MKVAKSIFWFVSLAYLVSISLGNFDLKYLLKPSIILSLLVYYWFAVEGKLNKLMLLALVFSIGGDFWLMFSGTNYFLLGLGSFLITHICYILIFSKNASIQPITLLIFGVLLLSMLVYLWPSLGDFKIPVVVYASTIITMAYMAYSTKNKVKQKQWIYLIAGSLLFVLSDSLIALEKFKSAEINIHNGHFWIMLTYILAQFLIVRGVILTSPKVKASMNREN